MRLSAKRNAELFLALVLIAAAFVVPRGSSIHAQVPAAPAAGLDSSKLPDAQGIHLGMPVEQALAVMKSLFPASTYLQTVTAGTNFR
jgi:hypothetical protein